MVRRANVTQNINDVKVLVDKAMACVQAPYWDKCFGMTLHSINHKQTADIKFTFRSHGKRIGSLHEV